MSFRFAKRGALLTYKTHIDKAGLLAFLNGVSTIPLLEYTIVHETSDEGYEHTHAFCWWQSRLDSRNCRIFDYDGIHPNIDPKPVTVGSVKKIVKYLKKQDNKALSNMGYDDLDPANKARGADTLKEALMECREPGHALGMKLLWEVCHETEEYKQPGEPKDGWQKELAEELAKEPIEGNRKIIWYVDKGGCTGKSWMSAYLEDWMGAVFFEDGISQHNIAAMIPEKPTIIGFDFGRGYDGDMKEMYKTIEACSNGRLTSGKYQGCRKRFRRPHIVVFANFYPNKRWQSADRWDIRDISKESPNKEKEEDTSM